MTKLNKSLWVCFSIFALAFMFTLYLRPYPLHFLVKSIPIFCLAVFALVNVEGKKGKLLGLGFLFSAIGDILLELPFKASFGLGLCSFLIAHLFYISVFLRRLTLTKIRGTAIGSMLLYSAVIATIFTIHLETMLLIPILVYLTVILFMGISASLGKENNPMLTIGACLFMISDSIIAINSFLSPVFLHSVWVMSTYYLAQVLIAIGVTRPLRELNSEI
ncbi:MAG: lysoplasmalogenase [Proteobacteria bacterium]|nr:lysoplasmalogenase [Pseudomonadota bacterium]